MSDVLMLAFWIWAIVLWIDGLERHRARLFSSALLIGAGALAKYFAIALIPLLVVYSLCKTKRLGSWLCFLLIPMAVLCFYEWATRSLYSHGLVLDAFRYVKETYAFSWRSAGLKLFTALAFFGGCHAAVLTLTPFLWRPRVWIAGAVLTGGLASISYVLLRRMAEFTDHPFLGAFAAQWAVMITSAVALCTIALSDLNRHRDAESLLLSLSVAGTFSFCLLNWSINGRSLLPATPAVAILLFRRLESVERGPPFACVGASLAVAAALSLAVAFADLSSGEYCPFGSDSG